jgi:hypothetical protein
MSDEVKAFSFQPEVITSGPEGEHVIVDALHYICLGSQTQGNLFYTPKVNKYWISQGTECSKELLKEKFIPYLRWDFDELEPEAIEKIEEYQDDKGKAHFRKIKVMTGRVVSKFPPSPENIDIQRKKILEQHMNEGKTISLEKLYELTAPRALLNNERFESMLDQSHADEKLARRLNSSSRY